MHDAIGSQNVRLDDGDAVDRQDSIRVLGNVELVAALGRHVLAAGDEGRGVQCSTSDSGVVDELFRVGAAELRRLVLEAFECIVAQGEVGDIGRILNGIEDAAFCCDIHRINFKFLTSLFDGEWFLEKVSGKGVENAAIPIYILL